TLRVEGDPKTDAPVRVFYTGSSTTTPVTESVTCTVGQDKKTIKIDIAPASRNPLTGFSADAYPEAFKALFLLFVLAAVLESALPILYNWRPFVENLNARAGRPVVSLAFALAFVHWFRLDLVTSLATLIRPDVTNLHGTGQILTAMVIAGGSAAVNNLM